MNSNNLHMYVLIAPLIGALLISMFGRSRQGLVAPVAISSLVISCLFSLPVLKSVLDHGGFRYTVGHWRPPFGIELVVDHLSALMMVLISGVGLVATFASLPRVRAQLPDRIYQFYTLYLILITGLVGLVLTGDAFNLYVLLEITSITSYGLIAMGSGRAVLSSFNYIIMGSIGACFYLLGVGYLYILTGTLNMSDLAQMIPHLTSNAALATAFGFMMVGLWIKMAFFPLHSWLPNAYSDAPDGAGVMIAPLMTKVTVYLMIRVMFSIFSPEFEFFSNPAVQNMVVNMAALAIVVASAIALSQKNLKRMLTYIIVAEVGYMVGGIWLANGNGMTGAVLHIVNDALMTLCLFLAVIAISHRIGSLELENFKGLYRKMPITMAAFTVGAFAMIGVPPTCGFFSKWYLILGGVESGQWAYVVALVFSSLINAVLFFRIIEIAFFRLDEDPHHASPELRQEAPLLLLNPLVVSALALILVGLGTGPLVEKVILFTLPGGF